MLKFIHPLRYVIVLAALACGAFHPSPLAAGEEGRPQISPAEQQLERMLARMSLADKAGQMTLVSKSSVRMDDLGCRNIGALLSGGGGNPPDNSPQSWRRMTSEFHQAARKCSGIPILYGVDAVHGHGNVKGAVVFPHSIGFGAAANEALIRESAAITAREMKATGANWNFAPALAMPRDQRWGRVYESFGDDPDLVRRMGLAYLAGLQSENVLGTPKHYLGEGWENWRSSKRYLLDEGDITVPADQLLGPALLPFRAAVDAGAMCIMVSRSSWKGLRTIANPYLLTGLLKEKLGFKGFLVSDWKGIDLISDDPYSNVVLSVNAGIDMVMVPEAYDSFLANLIAAAGRGDISQQRIDDAVRRILRAKQSIGLLENASAPAASSAAETGFESVGSPQHRAVARKAVRESLVLLKNNGILPLSRPHDIVFRGRGADNIGLQCGGWTVNWQGGSGPITSGTSIMDGFREAFPTARMRWISQAAAPGAAPAQSGESDLSIVVAAEDPYAEGEGDRHDAELSAEDLENLRAARQSSRQVVLIILAGRLQNIAPALEQADAVVMAWLPGSEGNGIVDVLTGKYDFKGRLPLPWPRAPGLTAAAPGTAAPAEPLFPRGFGLTCGKAR